MLADLGTIRATINQPRLSTDLARKTCSSLRTRLFTVSGSKRVITLAVTAQDAVSISLIHLQKILTVMVLPTAWTIATIVSILMATASLIVKTIAMTVRTKTVTASPIATMI